MQVRFHDINEHADRFPPPKVPMLPVLSLRTFLGRRDGCYPSQFLGLSKRLFLPSATAALAHAYKGLGIENGVGILIPAYHCGTMIEPALWLNAEIAFYRLNSDLTIELEDAERRIRPNTKALLITHYFGFPQPLEPISAFCRRHNLALIEDCAHAFFGQCQGITLGSAGDFSVTSTTKFFPTVEGGLLYSKCDTQAVCWVKNRRLSEQLKKGFDGLQTAIRYGRLKGMRPFFALVQWLADQARIVPAWRPSNHPGQSQYRWFAPELVGFNGCLFAQAVLRLSGKGRVAVKRRENYLYLLQNLGRLSRGRPLYPTLPESVVPYVFPLLIDFPETDFRKLKLEGIPILRWEELAETDCPVSADYRLRLLQLPCHQELRQHELEWLIAQVTKILG